VPLKGDDCSTPTSADNAPDFLLTLGSESIPAVSASQVGTSLGTPEQRQQQCNGPYHLRTPQSLQQLHRRQKDLMAPQPADSTSVPKLMLSDFHLMRTVADSSLTQQLPPSVSIDNRSSGSMGSSSDGIESCYVGDTGLARSIAGSTINGSTELLAHSDSGRRSPPLLPRTLFQTSRDNQPGTECFELCLPTDMDWQRTRSSSLRSEHSQEHPVVLLDRLEPGVSIKPDAHQTAAFARRRPSESASDQELFLQHDTMTVMQPSALTSPPASEQDSNTHGHRQQQSNASDAEPTAPIQQDQDDAEHGAGRTFAEGLGAVLQLQGVTEGLIDPPRDGTSMTDRQAGCDSHAQSTCPTGSSISESMTLTCGSLGSSDSSEASDSSRLSESRSPDGVALKILCTSCVNVPCAFACIRTIGKAGEARHCETMLHNVMLHLYTISAIPLLCQ
jgi:hypothetical protein